MRKISADSQEESFIQFIPSLFFIQSNPIFPLNEKLLRTGATPDVKLLPPSQLFFLSLLLISVDFEALGIENVRSVCGGSEGGWRLPLKDLNVRLSK